MVARQHGETSRIWRTADEGFDKNSMLEASADIHNL